MYAARESLALMRGGKRALPPASAERPEPGLARKALLDYAPVLRENAFGLPPSELSPITKKAEVSTLPPDITLVGAVAWPGKTGYAVVADSTGEQTVYKTGDYIFAAGFLRKVEKDRIVVESGGVRHEIKIAEIAAVKDIVGPRSSEASKIEGLARRSEEGLYMIDRRALQSALESPRQIMTDARLLPNMVGGKQEGFVVREVKPGGLYQGLGLRDGDVLLRVNEFSISAPESALQAFTALRGMDRIELDITRGGSKMTLTYVVR